ncbi:MAG: hypothetical protein K2N31_02920 [Treponemataceae bacterium]|nr:hypothetical protein [Treponemataceae bacterium]
MVIFAVLFFVVLMLILLNVGRLAQSTDSGGDADFGMERLLSPEIPPGALYEAAYGLYDDELSMEEELLWNEREADGDFDALDDLGIDC